jgi:hypothetical protein
MRLRIVPSAMFPGFGMSDHHYRRKIVNDEQADASDAEAHV